MREIGTIADGGAAQRLADYLLTLDITTKLDPKPAGTAVWVHREECVEAARRELGEFLRAPDDPKYAGVVQEAKALRKRAEREDRKHAKNTVSLNGRWDGRPSGSGRFPLTIALIAASALVTAYTRMGEDGPRAAPFWLVTSRVAHVELDREGEAGAKLVRVLDGPRGLGGVLRGEVWRLVTPIFVHMDGLHLLFNMLWLYQLGGLIESRRGSLTLLALAFASAVASNLGEVAWAGPVHAGGMSGVVYALFGYAWMVGRYDPASGLGVSSRTVQYMMLWLFACMTGLLGPVANAAHVVGLVVGLAAGYAPKALRRWF